jgi:hypothetical protein
MKKLIRRTEIKGVSDSRYRLTSPVRVVIYQDADGTYRASAAELGMWVDGLGQTQEEAISDLTDAIIAQRDSVSKLSASQCSGYAQAIKSAFEERIVED